MPVSCLLRWHFVKERCPSSLFILLINKDSEERLDLRFYQVLLCNSPGRLVCSFSLKLFKKSGHWTIISAALLLPIHFVWWNAFSLHDIFFFWQRLKCWTPHSASMNWWTYLPSSVQQIVYQSLMLLCSASSQRIFLEQVLLAEQHLGRV